MCVCVSGSRAGGVGWFFPFCDVVTCGVPVCGEHHVVGGIRNLGSVVSGSAGVGPDGEAQVMTSCPLACPASVLISRIRGILVLCCVGWFCPCMCDRGSIAVCLHRWSRVC